MASADENEPRHSIVEHLTELRTRIVYSIVFLFIGFLAGFFLTEKYLYEWVLQPIVNIPEAELQVLGPSEKFMSFFKTAFLVGFIVAFPFILYQLWLFLYPGLRKIERIYLGLMIPVSVVLFLAGSAFGFYVMIPAALRFLITFDLGVDITTSITLDKYFSFILSLILACGLVFQIPLVTFFLAKLGIVTAKMMSSQRRFAILIAVILGAMLTPTGDPINLMLLAVPIYLLYEISIVVAALTRKSRIKSDD